ncbi:MAG: hypothetical protein DWQ19_12360 [Crenarchaeota archaeon]|nr:MAG: hypothetical protein DWQ19_12360 [Thermoproteota archaeon]
MNKDDYINITIPFPKKYISKITHHAVQTGRFAYPEDNLIHLDEAKEFIPKVILGILKYYYG